MNPNDFIDTHQQTEAAASELRKTSAIRERARQLLSRARHGESKWFVIDEGFLETAAAEVIAATRRRYPRLHVPVHSRWRHFEAGGIDRKAQLDAQLNSQPTHLSRLQRGHSMIDLAFVSVLLDGGAGPDWKYVEPATGKTFTRSEGLAVASFHAFAAGMFSGNKDHPLQADSVGLRAVLTDHLASAFQVTPTNPLLGLEERAVLLRRLGETMAEQPEAFGEDGRPSGLFDMMISPLGPEAPPTADVRAHDILSEILMTCSGIWPFGNAIGNVPLGDCWRHSAVRESETTASCGGLTDGWMPFHKLSQWLTYSLIEPFEWCGVKVHHLDALTALPEYRNGGLLIDSGLLRLRDESAAGELWQPGDEIIVEWRALTVALLDQVADVVRESLRMTKDELPLACVLEGGTWAAGRELAQRHRGGLPPLRVATDGTVF